MKKVNAVFDVGGNDVAVTKCVVESSHHALFGGKTKWEVKASVLILFSGLVVID